MVPSDLATASLSAQDLNHAEPGFVRPVGQKFKESAQKKKPRMIKYRFILS